MGRFVGRAFLFILATLWAATAWAAPREVVFLTTSDLQSQLETFVASMAKDKKTVKVEVGGMARLAGAIKAEKAKRPGMVAAVTTGDDLMGKYFLEFKGQATYQTLTAAGMDLGTLGNHEFDLGVKPLARGLKSLGYPLVVSNMVITGPDHPLAKRFIDHMFLTLGGVKVGFFGLMTPDLAAIAKSGPYIKVDQDLAAPARLWVKKLRDQGAEMVVALTHIGLEADKKLAAQVAGLDVILGSHSHDMLLAGQEAVVTTPDGRQCIIVQDGTRGKYLGRLWLQWDQGRVTAYCWNPLLLDSSVDADPAVAAMVASYKAKLPPARVLAKLAHPLDTRSSMVRRVATPVGDMVCDIMRYRTGADVALQNGGGIRGNRIIPAGELTTEDVATMFPFGNSITLLKIKGRQIRLALEWGAACQPQTCGQFLQVGGLRYWIDPKQPAMRLKKGPDGRGVGVASAGSRVTKVLVTDRRGGWVALDEDNIYSVATNTYLASGGDGFFMLSKAQERRDTYLSIKSLVESVLADGKQPKPGKEPRIIIAK